MTCAARANCWAWIRCTSPMKANSWPWSRRNRPTRRWRRCTARPAGEAVHHRRSARAARRHGAGDHAVRRQPDRRYAGGRSSAADLLAITMADKRPRSSRRRRTASRAQPRSSSNSSRAKRAAWRSPAAKCRSAFFAADACWHSAADPTPPTRNTSRWNSCIPIIVGKRALPALDLSLAFRPWLDAHSPPRRYRDGLRSSGRRSGSRRRSRSRHRARGAMTFALPGIGGSYSLEPPTPRPVHAPGDDRNPLSHALGDRARLFRASRTGP